MNFEKWINGASIIFGVIGGVFLKMLGGDSKFLSVLMFMIIFDWITAIMLAVNDKKLNSKVGFKGFFKTVSIFILIALCFQLEKIVEIPIKDMIIMFFIGNTGISLLENILPFTDVPDSVKEIFEQIRNKGE